jgi:alpha-1,6-mannosyltransferase
VDKNFKKIFFASLILLIVIYASFYFSNQSIQNYSFSFILSSLIYLVAIIVLIKTDLSKTQTISVLLIFFLIKILFISIEPIGSDDYYRYLWDGKVQANGINPFQYAPEDPNLSFLHSELLPEKVSYSHIKTIYFPVSQGLFTLAYWISGESAVGLKIILFLAELLILISFYYLFKRLSINLKYILVYAVFPLVFFQFFIDAHVDLVGAALMLASITLYLYERKFWSYILLGLSISVKPTGLLLVPFLFQNEQKFSEKIKSVFIPIIVFIITFLPYVFTASPLNTLINFTAKWTFNGMIYNILNIFFSNNLTARIICGILFLIVFIFLFFYKTNFLKKVYLSLFLLMIFSPVVHPWYLIWFAVLLPVIRSYSGFYFVAAISLSSITVVIFQTVGVWQENTLILFVEYLPLTLIFFYEIFKERFWSKATVNP